MNNPLLSNHDTSDVRNLADRWPAADMNDWRTYMARDRHGSTADILEHVTGVASGYVQHCQQGRWAVGGAIGVTVAIQVHVSFST